MAIELKFTYCLFLMTCFGREKDSTSTFDCPTGATCWSAPAEEIFTSDLEPGFSLLCPNNCYRLLYDNAFSLRSTDLNSIIVQKSEINSQTSASPLQIKLSPLSVVLDDCSLNEKSADFQQGSKHSSFFHLFRADRLRYLTILKVAPFSIDWTAALSPFTRLDSLYIEECELLSLDYTFVTLTLPALRTLVIRSSKLEHIDRDAFSGGLSATLERLILADNLLKNALSLSEHTFPAVWQLDLSKNQLTFVPPEVNTNNFPVLKELNLASNRLKYYNAGAILSKFSLQQFRLEDDQQRNTIYYTDEAKEVFKSTKNALHSLPAFYLDSLRRSRFQLPIGGLVMWDQLTDSFPTYDYRPDNLFLRSDGKLKVDKEKALGSGIVRTINGSDWCWAFSFDHETNIKDYGKMIISSLSREINYPARLCLFSSRMVNHIIGRKTIPEEEIKLLADTIQDVLDEAAARFKYMVLVLFRTGDFPWGVTDEAEFPFSAFTSSQFNKIKILFDQIAQHSAMIGFEIMEDFMGAHAKRPVETTPTSTNCATTHVGIQQEMKVVGQLYYWLKSHYPKNVLYGLSLSADCKACFDLATMIDCRQRHYMVPDVTGMDIDFVTLTSNFYYSNTEGNEVLGFKKMTKLQRDALNGRDFSAEVKSRAIFYRVNPPSLVGDQNQELLFKYSSGAFIRRSPADRYEF